MVHKAKNKRCRVFFYLLIAGIVITFYFSINKNSNISLYERVRSCSVEICVNGKLTGSGCFAGAGGLVLTTEHVIAGPKDHVEVITKTGARLAAKVIAVDCGHDLALLRVPASPQDYPALQLAEAMPPVGEDVYVFGSPLFRRDIMLKGSVARPNMLYEWLGGVKKRYHQVYCYSAMVPAGVSGGPWVNDAGQLIGVQSGSMQNDRTQLGLAFVAPLSAIRKLIHYQETSQTPTPGIAVENLWEHKRSLLNNFPDTVSGVIVADIVRGGPMDRTKCNKSDIITAVDGQAITSRECFLKYVRAKIPGDKIKLEILAPNQKESHEITITLDCLEKLWLKR